MADPKTQIILDGVSLGKIWDKKMGKPASDALSAAAEKALKSSKTEVVSKIEKGAEGYKVSLNIEVLELDSKKNVLSATVKGVIAKMPEDKYFAGLSNNGKIPDPDQKKIENDVKALMDNVGESIGGKIIKSLP